VKHRAEENGLRDVILHIGRLWSVSGFRYESRQRLVILKVVEMIESGVVQNAPYGQTPTVQNYQRNEYDAFMKSSHRFRGPERVL
jgi:hypothetical protein